MKSADPSQRPQNKVTIGKVVTEQNFVAQSSQLEHALHNRQFAEFCSLKINNTKKEDDEMVWKFLKVRFITNLFNVVNYDFNIYLKKHLVLVIVLSRTLSCACFFCRVDWLIIIALSVTGEF